MPKSTPRIPPAEPPYPADVEAALEAMMPRDSLAPPLALFRTFALHPRLATAMHGLGRFLLGRELSIGVRAREIVIHRVCARCGCEYEWGVHAAFFAGRAGLSEEQLEATVNAGPESPAWSAEDSLLLRLVDELHDDARVSDALWAELAERWSTPQLLELLLLAGWYHAIAYLANGAGVQAETWARTMRAGDRGSGAGRNQD